MAKFSGAVAGTGVGAASLKVLFRVVDSSGGDGVGAAAAAREARKPSCRARGTGTGELVGVNKSSTPDGCMSRSVAMVPKFSKVMRSASSSKEHSSSFFFVADGDCGGLGVDVGLLLPAQNSADAWLLRGITSVSAMWYG